MEKGENNENKSQYNNDNNIMKIFSTYQQMSKERFHARTRKYHKGVWRVYEYLILYAYLINS
jgi:hypothetical protein